MKLNIRAIDVMLAEKQVSRSDLAKKAGMCRQSISTILTRGSCTPVTAGKLAAALGVSVGEIITEAPRGY